MADIKVILSILRKYQLEEPLSDAEQTILEHWLRASEDNQSLFDDISNEVYWKNWVAETQLSTTSGRKDKVWDEIRARVEATRFERPRPLRRLGPRFYWSAAAALVLVIGVTVLWRNTSRTFADRAKTSPATDVRFADDIAVNAGHPRLNLSNGAIITLDSLAAGKLKEETTGRFYQKDRETIVVAENSNPTDENTLVVPVGAQYKIELADGTRVWLNANSSLRFPSTFSGDLRKVSLEGEAYFDVARQEKSPFVVMVGDQSVRVLGTHFNVVHYPETPVTVSLVEGSVRFRRASDSLTLSPGQSVKATDGMPLTALPFDKEQTLAWQQNLFWFQDATIEEVMKEISRWYPIQVHYRGTVSHHFSVALPRSRSLGEVLRSLEKPGYVHFTLTDNQLEVMPTKT